MITTPTFEELNAGQAATSSLPSAAVGRGAELCARLGAVLLGPCYGACVMGRRGRLGRVKGVAALTVAILAVGGCTAAQPFPHPSTTTAATAAARAAVRFAAPDRDLRVVADPDPVQRAIQVSRVLFAGAPGVVLAPLGDPASQKLAAAEAARLHVPDVEVLRRAVMTTDPIVLTTDETESTASLTTTGLVKGPLVGGNLGMMATAAGWSLPTLAGCIWFIEDVNKAVGQIDRWLTQLLNAGHLSGVAGVAVGRFLDCAPRVIEVLRDRLARLHVPILGGLPVGHGRHSMTMPIGAQSTLDADAATLDVAAGVR